MANHFLKLSSIINYFNSFDKKRLIERGENAVKSKHIKSFHFVPELKMIRGEVYASMKDRTYEVEIDLDNNAEIINNTCRCPRGTLICHHVAALCLYAYENISSTDVECKWSIRKTIDEPPKPIEDIFPRTSHQSINRDLTEDEIRLFQQKISLIGKPIGFSWLLAAEPAPTSVHIINIEDLIFSTGYLSSPDQKKYFTTALEVDDAKIRAVASLTVGQGKNEQWLVFRKNRLTASNFGVVLAAVKRNKYPISLYRRLTGYYNLENVKAIQWGISHEEEALNELASILQLQAPIIKTGFWLHNCGYLGGSPDGLVGDDFIVGVKCPFKYRDKNILEELRKDKTYIVFINDNNLVEVNEKHEYFHQIQGCLNITKRTVCYLVIWTPEHTIIEEIKKKENWEENILLLKKFYIEHYIPYLYKDED